MPKGQNSLIYRKFNMEFLSVYIYINEFLPSFILMHSRKISTIMRIMISGKSFISGVTIISFSFGIRSTIPLIKILLKSK